MKRAKILLLMLALMLLCSCGVPQTALDRDADGGYIGDFVLIYNPAREGPALSTGDLSGLVQTGAQRYQPSGGTVTRRNAELFAVKDAAITDQVRAELTAAQEQTWEIGTRRIFYITRNKRRFQLLMEISAEGEACRIWQPVNPLYGRLTELDPGYPEALAAEIDRGSAILDAQFGPIPDPKGDGKANVLCYDMAQPTGYGLTVETDLFAEYYDGTNDPLPGNGLPMVHINAAPALQLGFTPAETAAVAHHELSHLRTLYAAMPEGLFEDHYLKKENTALFREHYDDALWMTEFLAIPAVELCQPGRTLQNQLAWWHYPAAGWSSLAENQSPCVLRYSGGISWQAGGTVMYCGTGDFTSYAILTLLAHFAENRGGPEVFPAILARWQEMGCTGDPWQAVYECLGYSDYGLFLEDFLLSVLLHDSDFQEGRYRLEPFECYDPALCGGEEDPFSLLIPVVTEDALKLSPGGFTLVRPLEGRYVPPEDADPGLCCIGVTLGEPQ